MEKWYDIAKLQDFPPNSRRLVNIAGQSIIVFNVNGEFFALEDRCSHDDSPLHEGEIEGDEIICPWHGARFCLKTGAVTEPPAYEDIQAYPVRVHAGMVQLQSL